MKLLALALLLFVGTAQARGDTDVSIYTKARRAVVELSYGNGNICGGVAISKHAVLTSTHCILYTAEMPKINGQTTKARELMRDGFDTSIIETSMTFSYWAPIAKKVPYIGEDVFSWGFPAALSCTLFKGYRAGELDMVVLGELKHYTTFDMNGFAGSSGSPIFNYKGEVVGTVSVRTLDVRYDNNNRLSMVMSLVGSRPYEFTKQQWAEAGVVR